MVYQIRLAQMSHYSELVIQQVKQSLGAESLVVLCIYELERCVRPVRELENKISGFRV